jgi:hypothetical protein
MRPKPSHLGPAYAVQFTDLSVVAAYHHRPPYPAEVFDLLTTLIVDTPRVVLDLGPGTGSRVVTVSVACHDTSGTSPPTSFTLPTAFQGTR